MTFADRLATRSSVSQCHTDPHGPPGALESRFHPSPTQRSRPTVTRVGPKFPHAVSRAGCAERQQLTEGERASAEERQRGGQARGARQRNRSHTRAATETGAARLFGAARRTAQGVPSDAPRSLHVDHQGVGGAMAPAMPWMDPAARTRRTRPAVRPGARPSEGLWDTAVMSRAVHEDLPPR
jgi:hypothetical protein